MTRPLRVTRRQALAATAVTPLALVASGEGALVPPNIVFILADDPTSTDELGGYSRVSSALAALIRQGVDSGRSIELTGTVSQNGLQVTPESFC